MKSINKKLKLTCGLLSASLILSTLTMPTFATSQINEYGSSTSMTSSEDESTASPEPTEPTSEPTSEPTATPGIINMDMDVTATIYTTDDKNTYKIVFKSDSSLPEITAFDITATFENVTLESSDFGESFKNNGKVSKSITDDKTVKYVWTGETVVGGSAALVSAIVESSNKITKENFTIDEFTATTSNGSKLNVNPEIKLENGVNMPTLSENEQNAYDALVLIPEVHSFTFYNESKQLQNLELVYTKPIDAAITLYNNLSKSSKLKVDTALSLSDLSIETYTNVQSAANSMLEVYGIIELIDCYADIKDDNTAINYQYLKETFDNISKAVPTAMNKATKAVEEYNKALAEIEIFNGYINKAVEDMSDKTDENFQNKIAALKVQFESAKANSTYVYSKAFMTSLQKLATDLYNDIDTNSTSSYKKYMLEEIESINSSITDGNIIYGNLPTFSMEYNTISIDSQINLSFKRKQKLIDQEAKIEVYVYNQDNKQLQTGNKNFTSGNTSASISLSIKSNIYKVGETVLVKAYYVYDNISYYLGSSPLKISKSSHINKPSGGSTGGSTGGNGTGTVYPTAVPDKPKPTKSPNYANENPYNDIDKYDWAKEAIIGLTNAGIVNGMGDDEFNPAGNVTREQFCKMVVQLFEISALDTSSDFVDVDENAWYAPYINAAVQAGYVQGQSDDYFGIGEVIMRQDMATILYRASNRSGNGVELTFTDNAQIADYAKDAISEFVGLDVMKGYEDGTFKPRGSATRAEAAKVIWGVYILD